MNLKACLVFMLLFSGLTLATKPIRNLIDVAVPVKLDGANYSLENVKQAIINGCREKYWIPKMAAKDTIECSIKVRGKHDAEVSIEFNQTSYSIRYKSSHNLKYNAKKQRIHRNYNKWVDYLSASIQRAFGEL